VKHVEEVVLRMVKENNVINVKKVLNIEYILYTQGHAFGKLKAIGSGIIFIEY
jgi:hypothetical protein